MKGKTKKAGGGGLPMKVSGNPDVFEEAEERKHGGKVKHKRKHKREHETKAEMRAEGEHPRHRMDRPGRKRGGRVGADKAPLSSAHSTTSPSREAD